MVHMFRACSCTGETLKSTERLDFFNNYFLFLQILMNVFLLHVLGELVSMRQEVFDVYVIRVLLWITQEESVWVRHYRNFHFFFNDYKYIKLLPFQYGKKIRLSSVSCCAMLCFPFLKLSCLFSILHHFKHYFSDSALLNAYLRFCKSKFYSTVFLQTPGYSFKLS